MLSPKNLKEESGDGKNKQKRNKSGVDKGMEAAIEAAVETAVNAEMEEEEEEGTLFLDYCLLTDTYRTDLNLSNPWKKPLHFEVSNNLRHKVLTKPCLGSMSTKESAVVNVSVRPQWLESINCPQDASVGSIQIHLSQDGHSKPLHTHNFQICFSKQAMQTLKESKRLFNFDNLKKMRIPARLRNKFNDLTIFNYPKLLFCLLLVFSFFFFDLCLA